MSDNNDGGSAFPFGQISEQTGQPINGYFSPGMTIRDWFAGMAVSGENIAISIMVASGKVPTPNDWNGDVVKGAYAIADAMIAARERKPES